MKTQIITLAAHDDLISIRDRLSWAKAPRILLVWPSREQVRLQPLDLRILQQHARELGADLGLVAREASVRRDARAFGIPVFRSTTDAQRLPWDSANRRARRRLAPIHKRIGHLRELRRLARPAPPNRISSPAVRMSAFVAAVLSVFSIASIFVPRATIVLVPSTEQQSLSISVDLIPAGAPAKMQPGIPLKTIATQVRGQRTVSGGSQSEVGAAKASGDARLQNLSTAPLLVPAGTIVFSLAPELRRYVALEDTRLDAGANGTATVRIEALDAGSQGNLPAESLVAAEGSLSASIAVSNPEPIVGGKGEAASVPSQTDRDALRVALQDVLKEQARTAIESTLQSGDVLLPASLALKSIDREEFDPQVGRASGVLSLTLEATFEAQYVREADLRALATAALDAQRPPGYAAKDGSLQVQVNGISGPPENGIFQMQLQLRRALSHGINSARAIQLVRGVSPHRAGELLQGNFPLAGTPEIRLAPTWWPWLPLIPFRIEIVEL